MYEPGELRNHLRTATTISSYNVFTICMWREESTEQLITSCMVTLMFNTINLHGKSLF